MKNALIAVLLFLSAGALNASTFSFHLQFDTSSIAAATPGFVEIQFNQANGATSLAAMASVDNYSQIGYTFNSGSNYTSGGVTGSPFSPPLVFDNTVGGANVFGHGIAEFGSYLAFDVTFSGDALNMPADDGSEFFVSFLAADFSNLIIAGPVASIALNGTPSITLNTTSVSTIEPTPEPSTILMCFGGLLLLAGRFRR